MLLFSGAIVLGFPEHLAAIEVSALHICIGCLISETEMLCANVFRDSCTWTI